MVQPQGGAESPPARDEVADKARALGEASGRDLTVLENLHELRLAVKRLRYAREALRLPKDDATAVLEEAQKRLGEVNDVATLVTRLGAYGAESGEKGAAISRLAARFAALRDLRAARAVEWWTASGAASRVRGLSDHDGGPAPHKVASEAPRMHATQTIEPHRNGVARTAVEAAQRNLWLSGRRIAVIDIGSNSIRLLCVELADEKSWKVLAEERAMTRLAHGLSATGQLCAEAMAHSVEAIGRFKTIADKLDAHAVRAFATAAVREAANRGDFLSLVKDRTGLSLELVSALDEGKLTYRSVARVFDLSEGPAAVVDIGGGSLEVVTSSNGVVTSNTSMPLGAVRVTEGFGGAQACSGARYKAMRRHARDQIARRVARPKVPPTTLVGCGGTFTTLLTLSAASRGVLIERNSPALAELGPVTRTQVAALIDRLRAMTLEERLRVPGLPSDRADIVIAGFTVIERLMKRLRVDQISVHPGGFREGLLLRMIDEQVTQHQRAGTPTSDADLLTQAREFAARCRYERAHSEHVAGLALSLYDQFLSGSDLIPGLGKSVRERTLLETAAVLHDVGVMVEYRAHHKHCRTIVRHAAIPALSTRECELIAQVCRYHRKAEPALKHRDFEALDPSDRELVRRLAGLLRVADGLDRSHAQATSAVHVRFGGARVTVEAETLSDADTDLEAARNKSGLLAKVLGVDIEIVRTG